MGTYRSLIKLTKTGIFAAGLYPSISPKAILFRIRLCSFKIYSFCASFILTMTRSGEHDEPKL